MRKNTYFIPEVFPDEDVQVKYERIVVLFILDIFDKLNKFDKSFFLDRFRAVLAVGLRKEVRNNIVHLSLVEEIANKNASIICNNFTDSNLTAKDLIVTRDDMEKFLFLKHYSRSRESK